MLPVGGAWTAGYAWFPICTIVSVIYIGWKYAFDKWVWGGTYDPSGPNAGIGVFI